MFGNTRLDSSLRNLRRAFSDILIIGKYTLENYSKPLVINSFVFKYMKMQIAELYIICLLCPRVLKILSFNPKTQFSPVFLATTGIGFPLTSLQQMTALALHGKFTFMNKYLRKCANLNTRWTKLNNIEFNNPVERGASAYANEWQNIMNNYSYRVKERNLFCENGKLVHHKKSPFIFYKVNQLKYMDDDVQYANIAPIAVEDKIQSLAFVSCGEKELSGLPFKEFLNVYNSTVWYFLLSVILIVTLIPRLFKMNQCHSCSTYFEMLIRRVLTQNESLSNQITRINTVRIILAALYFALIVLTNAYKSDNMQRLSSPRDTLPYENISQLIQDGFTTYARISYILIRLRPYSNSKINGFGAREFGHSIMQDLPYQLSMGSEIHRLWKEQRASVKFLLKHAYVHKSVYRWIEESNSSTIFKTGKLFANQFSDGDAEVENFKNLFFEKQKTALHKHLYGCNKSALVFPRYLSHKYQRILQRKNLHADVGTEKYFQMMHVFSMSGLVSPNTIFRIGRYKASGIPEWWQQHLSDIYNSQVKNVKYPKEANLSGNIVVVFFIYLVFIAVSMVAFFVEKLPDFWSAIILVINYLSLFFRMVYKAMKEILLGCCLKPLKYQQIHCAGVKCLVLKIMNK